MKNIPQIWLDKFFRGFFSPERPDFHPEKYLGLHILQVYVNALATKDPDIILAALLHDICKADNGKMVHKEKFSYWSNVYHDQDGVSFIMENPTIQQWIVDCGASLQVVSDICRYHMREKVYKEMRSFKQEKYLAETAHIREKLEKFSQCDKMT